MLIEQVNSNKQGDVGMGAAIAYFSKQGFTVSIPLTDSQDYDMVVEDNLIGELHTVQVKTTYSVRNGNFRVDLRTKYHNGQAAHMDHNRIKYVFVLTEENDQYLIPTKALNGAQSFTLNDRLEKYKV